MQVVLYCSKLWQTKSSPGVFISNALPGWPRTCRQNTCSHVRFHPHFPVMWPTHYPEWAKLSSIITGNSGQSVVLQDKSIKLIFPPDWSQDYLDHPSVEENKYMKWNYGFLGTWDPFLYLNPWKWLSDIYMHLLQIPSPYLAARMKACTFDLDGLIMPARDRWRARNCSLLQQKQTLHS